MIEYLTSNLWLIWIIISILCLILELSSGDFFLLCFAIGAAVGAIVAGCGLSLTWQIIIFALIGWLCVTLFRMVFHLYRTIWRYAGPMEYISLMAADALATLLFMVLRVLFRIDITFVRAGTLMMMGFMTWVVGVLSDTISAERKILEDVQYHARRADYQTDKEKEEKTTEE